MRRTKSTMFCALVGALFGLSWCVHARAQSTPPAPLLRPRIDANQVDLVTGYLEFGPPEMSIGPSGPSELTYSPITFTGGGLQEGTDPQYTGRVVTNYNGQQYQYVVTIGTYSEFFQEQSGSSTITSTEGLPSTLTEDSSGFTYTAADGTVAVFSNSVSNVNGTGSTGAYMTSLTLPDGEVRTYNYVNATMCTSADCSTTPDTITRLQSVTNNRGYQIKFLYLLNGTSLAQGQDTQWNMVTGAMGINMAVDYCDPLASACTSTTQSWPTASIDFNTLNVTDSAGGVTQYVQQGNSISISLPGSTAPYLVYTETTAGQITSVTRGGQVWNYSYSATSSELTTVVTDPAGDKRTYVFDATTHALDSYTNNTTGEVTSYQNDSSGRPTTITLPSGQSLRYVYDARGNIQETDLDAAGETNLVWTANFDSTCTNPKTCNKPNWTTDPENNETDYTYDPTSGQVSTVTLPAPTAGAPRPQTSYAYTPYTSYYKNASGQVVADGTYVYYLTSVSTCRTTSGCSSTSPDQLRSEIVYGSDGVANNREPTSATTQDGAGTLVSTRSFDYDSIGNLIAEDGPMSFQRTTMKYDGLRRVVGQAGPSLDGSGTYVGVRTTYDPMGFPATVDVGTLPGQTDSAWQSFAPLRTIARQFDSQGRVTQTALEAGGATYSVQQVSYDSVGRVDCTATRMNPATFGGLPSSACSATQPGSFGPDRIVKYNYYAGTQRVSSIITGYGTTGAIAPRSMTYYPGGALHTVADGNGYMTTYAYDPDGRLSYIYYPDPGTVGASSTSDYEKFAYDQDSQVVSIRRRSGVVIGTPRDALGRVSQIVLPNDPSGSIYYSYDNQGRLLTALYGSATGTGITQTYDGLGRLYTRTVFGMPLTHAYDLANRLVQLTYPDGFYVKYNYLNEELKTVVDNTNVTLATYSYDTLGTLTGLKRGNNTTTTYTRDAIERLQNLTQDLSGTAYDFNATFAYNPAGQITSKTQNNDAAYTWLPSPSNQTISSTVDNQNQLSYFMGTTVTHDANGDVLSGTNSLTYSYDVLGHLYQATSATGTVTLKYDPLGVLSSETNGGTVTDYLYDGGNLVAEYVNGALAERFVYGAAPDRPLMAYQGSGTGSPLYLYADERGSIIAASDANGAATGSVKYSSYGQSGALVSPFGFTGQLYMPDLQLYYYRARMYSPQTGRFMQPDPAGYADNMNLYAYADGDPANLADPSGLLACYPGVPLSQFEGDTYGVDSKGVPTMSGDYKRGIPVPDICFQEPTFAPLPPVSLPGGVPSGGSGSTAAPNAPPQTDQCTLVAPTGQYRTASGVDARFNPATAGMLSTALANLNQQGIVPVITSGYRSPALQGSLSTSNSPYVITPARVSWHEVGAAVDFGPNSNAGYFTAIRAALTAVGFVWGGNFRTPDQPHFQSQPAGTSPSPALVSSCARAASGG